MRSVTVIKYADVRPLFWCTTRCSS